MKTLSVVWQGALCALLLMLVAAPELQAREISTVRPDRVGMSAERLDRITELGRNYVEAGQLAGIVTLVARDGRIAHFEAQGVRNLETGEPMTKDTLFRIYSMSKPITAVAAMILYEEGAFQLSDPVSKFLPEFADLKVWEDGELVDLETPMTMHHLLTHTAGFSYGFNPRDPVDQMYNQSGLLAQSTDLDDFIARLAEIPLRYQPGSRWHYSVAVDVTGAVVERISGQSFDEFLRTRLFEPLGMRDTFFAVPADKRDRLGTNHRWDGGNEQLVALPVPPYPLWEDTTFFSGGGGLISTARDYLRFAEMLRNGGELNGVRILSPKTIHYMVQDHLPGAVQAIGTGEAMGTGLAGAGSGFGLGFGVVNDPVKSSVIGSTGEYSWGGAAGTIFWVDPVEDMIVIGMIQLMGSPWPLRSELKVLSNQALTETRAR
jgi:CubicO group peptidase (beta-lactamase class C family)